MVLPEHVELCKRDAIKRLYHRPGPAMSSLFVEWLLRVRYAQDRIVMYAEAGRYYRLDLLDFIHHVFTSNEPTAKLVLKHYWNHQRVVPYLKQWYRTSTGEEKAQLGVCLNLMMVN